MEVEEFGMLMVVLIGIISGDTPEPYNRHCDKRHKALSGAEMHGRH